MESTVAAEEIRVRELAVPWFADEGGAEEVLVGRIVDEIQRRRHGSLARGRRNGAAVGWGRDSKRDAAFHWVPFDY